MTVCLSSLVPCWVGIYWGVMISDFYHTAYHKWFQLNDSLMIDTAFSAISLFYCALEMYPFTNFYFV